MIVYKVTNLINNRIYVGQTIQSLNVRWRAHQQTGEIFRSQKEAAEKLGVFQANINNVLKNKRKSTGGYSFKYLSVGE